MTKTKFIKKVKKEVKLLRQLPKKWLKKLDAKTFCALNEEHCIYGQLFGHSENEISNFVAKKRFANVNIGSITREGTNFSPLEVYVAAINEDRIEPLLTYIKGETDEFDFNII